MSVSVPTEMTDMQSGARGWIFYDAECELCRRWVRRTQRVLGRRGFAFVPLQTAWARWVLHVSDEQLLKEMRVVLRNGGSFGGADAIVELAKHVWWAWPFAAIARIPVVREILRVIYGQVAARRKCLSHACSLPRSSGRAGTLSRKGGPCNG